MAQMMLINPRKRRRKTAKKRAAPKRRRSRTMARVRRSSPARRRRRNPINLDIKSIMKNTLMPSATAAGGALAVDLALGYIPLPDMLKTGPMRHVVKGVAAIGMGMLASIFVKPKTAELFATGAMTIAIYDASKEAIAQIAPEIKMGAYDDMDDLGYRQPGYVVSDESMDYYPGEEMGAYNPEDLEL